MNISQQLTYLRKTQASGQLLVAIGGFVAFMALSRQIPLLDIQASTVKRLEKQVEQLLCKLN